jgi:hypothetical protein
MSRLAGTWWRSSRYTIENGWIRPAAGPLEQFDPWEAFWDRPPGHVSKPPYIELVNLARRLPIAVPESAPPLRLNQESESELLGWTAKNGLLGVLLHVTQHVSTVDETVTPAGDRIVTRTFAEGPEWDSWTEELQAEEIGKVRSEALVVPFPEGPARFEPLGKTWGPHFPNVDPSKWEAGSFLSLAHWPEFFWSLYGEKVNDFLWIARYFSEAVGLVAEADPKYFVGGLQFHDETKDAGRSALNKIMKSSYPVLAKKKDGMLERRLIARSLIGMFALMAVEDLLRQRYLYTCPCGDVFSSAYPDTKYCSSRHRERYRKRAKRERVRRASANLD